MANNVAMIKSTGALLYGLSSTYFADLSLLAAHKRGEGHELHVLLNY